MSSMSRCCDTGRPIAVDPASGRTICSCQMQRGVPSYLSRVPTLPETVYGTGTGLYPQTNMLSAMYKMYGHDGQIDPITMTQGGRHPSLPMTAHAIAAHPYGIGYPGFDINGAPRKNATRETTSPLKAWLYTHKKNPYPTKAEKIMLAIVTRMTLTQVSTWFANARRRLKKENRLNGKEDDTLSDISGNDDRIDVDSSADQLIFRDADDVSSNAGNLSDISEASDTNDHNTKTSRIGKKCVQKLFSPDGRNELFLERISSPEIAEHESRVKSDNIETHAAIVNDTHMCDDTQEVVKGHVNDNAKTNGVVAGDIRVSSDKVTVPAPQQKPKIWSIVQMIG